MLSLLAMFAYIRYDCRVFFLPLNCLCAPCSLVVKMWGDGQSDGMYHWCTTSNCVNPTWRMNLEVCSNFLSVYCLMNGVLFGQSTTLFNYLKKI